MKMIYMIGEPGSGKTTWMRAVMESLQEPQLPVNKPFKCCLFCKSRTLVLGHYDQLFGGTDTLSYTAAGVIKAELVGLAAGFGCERVLAEGDRLANDSFFEWAMAKLNLTVLLLDTPAEVAAARRRTRGTGQNESWVNGRITKVRGLAGRWPVVRVAGNDPAQELISVV